ncbi:cellulose biosynthesis protein CelD [Bradyrhizobium japonicum]|uniref:Cellulose biosynthesis protein CelD n=1 Tax=Bradyrhizobium japonicum TaxID=375 RepID=A0A0A3Z533_BRAJP|nr:GNAT family N-acetyltransferase [Bradyrhizobium japonicum]KGT80968.1 cellulose biosynthesis protein CelD [Bradyrhizobium japonicum]MCS3892697.1 CelD/BcsL family acetyltransferase involved in cellulose biosynthesis [Bradyrhizobium japonicum USDA 38]MCS3945210.1 CelD/BcsL family acetyltransferase involved in cellulose biosynthesis [Bradyrhizobium japonicum]MCW2222263.1 CelD/BcsL family acetyltransferase involved in cellulose biosynthesis [Bradyrhizobium japonicum]MCW2346875.1 CelD/BcsL family
MTFLSVEQSDGLVSSTSGIAVDFVRDWRQAASRLSAGHRTAFQHGYWLGAWYEAFHDSAPLIALISDAATGKDIAVVPMISHIRRGIRIVEFADLGVSDNNAPILALDAALDTAATDVIGRALVDAVRALPDRFDLLRLKKMPAHVGGKPNPLVSLGRIGSCSLNGNLVLTGDDYEAYRASIKRMQMPRCWRVFSRHAGARFEIATDVARARELLDVMDVQQQARMRKLGSRFVLDDDAHARFYREVARQGIAEGYAVISALVCDEAVVATTFGVRSGANYFLLRISHAGDSWSSCSPGLLVTERTMAELHAKGVRRFDLSIGNQDYKRRFGAEKVALTDVSIALCWRGAPYAWRDHAAQNLRRYPRLAAVASRAIRKMR